MTKRKADHIDDYLRLHTLMQGFDKALAKNQGGAKWYAFTPEDARGGLEGDSLPEPLEIETEDFRDSLGRDRTIVLGRQNASANDYYVWLSEPPATTATGKATVVHRDAAKSKFYATHMGLPIYNDRFMYDHQAGAVGEYARARHKPLTDGTSREVAVFATGTGKSYIIAHTLKAVGGEGVVIAPKGLGEQVAKEIKEVIPAGCDIRLGSELEGDAATLKAQLQPFKGILVIEENDLARFMGTESHKGWLCDGTKKMVCIDEAHEFTVSSTPNQPPAGAAMLQRLAKANDILAVTATPNDALYDALGIADRKPAVSMTMYDAQHRLKDRAFRPLALELKQVGNPHPVKDTDRIAREQINRANEPAMRFEALAGYFGRDEYAAPDYCRPDPNEGWSKRPDVTQRYQSAKQCLDANESRFKALPNPPSGGDAKAKAVIEAMGYNRIRYSNYKNIAFAVRNALVRNVATDFQAIHDGGYGNIDALNHEVWKRRAQSAIAEYIRMYNREFGLPESLENVLHARDLNILKLRDENLPDGDNQKHYQEAVRRIDPEDFREVLPLLFASSIGSPEAIDLQHEAKEAARNNARAAQLRSFAAKELNISSKEARRLDIAGELEARLQQEGITPPEFDCTAPYYALSVIGDVPGEEQVFDPRTGKQLPLTGDDVAQMVRDGKVMNVANNHRFTTGFSDPDVMMSQRVIENLGDYIIRGTQILGRPIREKDGVAALHEIVGPLVNLTGERGVDRHFSCYDVTSKHYLDHAAEFSRHWEREGKEVWKPSTSLAGPVEAVASGRQNGQERA